MTDNLDQIPNRYQTPYHHDGAGSYQQPSGHQSILHQHMVGSVHHGRQYFPLNTFGGQQDIVMSSAQHAGLTPGMQYLPGDNAIREPPPQTSSIPFIPPGRFPSPMISEPNPNIPYNIYRNSEDVTDLSTKNLGCSRHIPEANNHTMSSYGIFKRRKVPGYESENDHLNQRLLARVSKSEQLADISVLLLKTDLHDVVYLVAYDREVDILLAMTLDYLESEDYSKVIQVEPDVKFIITVENVTVTLNENEGGNRYNVFTDQTRETTKSSEAVTTEMDVPSILRIPGENDIGKNQTEYNDKGKHSEDNEMRRNVVTETDKNFPIGENSSQVSSEKSQEIQHVSEMTEDGNIIATNTESLEATDRDITNTERAEENDDDVDYQPEDEDMEDNFSEIKRTHEKRWNILPKKRVRGKYKTKKMRMLEAAKKYPVITGFDTVHASDPGEEGGPVSQNNGSSQDGANSAEGIKLIISRKVPKPGVKKRGRPLKKNPVLLDKRIANYTGLNKIIIPLEKRKGRRHKKRFGQRKSYLKKKYATPNEENVDAEADEMTGIETENNSNASSDDENKDDKPFHGPRNIRSCKVCFTHHINDKCDLLPPKAVIPDRTVCTNSTYNPLQTLPLEVCVVPSKKGLFAHASVPLARSTQFGPLFCQEVEFKSLVRCKDFSYIWVQESDKKKKSSEENISKFFSTADEYTNNWCSFLRTSLFFRRCNMMMITVAGQIHFITSKDIERFEQLIVYAPYLDSISQTSRDMIERTRKLTDIFKCPKCLFDVPGLSNFVKHCRILHPDGLSKTKCECKYCGEFLDSYKALRTHAKSVHADIASFECHLCGRFLQSTSSLKLHIRSVHKESEPSTCEKCGRVFYSRPKFRSHVRDYHAETCYKCEKCGKEFKMRQCYSRHVKAHDKNFTFSCEKCGKIFRDGFNLKVHLLKHSGKKPFQCVMDGCDAGFTTKQCLQIHYRKNHGCVDANMPKIDRTVPFTFEDYGLDAAKEISDIVNSESANNVSYMNGGPDGIILM